jgi:drug/metabolite transporter (DMT)-like permease
LGFLVFGSVPALWTWAGSAVIIASGLYMAFGESWRAQAQRATPAKAA